MDKAVPEVLSDPSKHGGSGLEVCLTKGEGGGADAMFSLSPLHYPDLRNFARVHRLCLLMCLEALELAKKKKKKFRILSAKTGVSLSNHTDYISFSNRFKSSFILEELDTLQHPPTPTLWHPVPKAEIFVDSETSNDCRVLCMCIIRCIFYKEDNHLFSFSILSFLFIA